VRVGEVLWTRPEYSTVRVIHSSDPSVSRAKDSDRWNVGSEPGERCGPTTLLGLDTGASDAAALATSLANVRRARNRSTPAAASALSMIRKVTSSPVLVLAVGV
jgi:hypothetical protein